MNIFSKNKAKADTRIIVAMSGGVDSSVVAAMMAEQGYDVVGITLQLYDHGQALAKKNACCAGQDIQDAKNVCQSINIPHYVLDYESLFREAVMEDFADSYMRGETPIPCVRCNQTVKFRDLLKVAKNLKGDALVTGHYVQKINGENGAELHCGIDSDKDQSYFLFATTKEQLEYLHFPLGSMTKAETRSLAEKFNLPVAHKAESQDICFVPNGDYTAIVSKLRPGALDKGEIVRTDGTVIGEHDGIIKYTIGQRKGLGIGGGDPLYVIKINPVTKQVIVGAEADLYQQEFYIKDINWNADAIPEEGLKAQVRIRSLGQNVEAMVYVNTLLPPPTPPASRGGEKEGDASVPPPSSLAEGHTLNAPSPAGALHSPSSFESDTSSPPLLAGGVGGGSAKKHMLKITLKTPQRAITPGQACVIYDGARVLGGGWITSHHQEII